MGRIKLKVLGLTSNKLPTRSFMLVLSDESDRYRLPVIVRAWEAHAIALYPEGGKVPRLTLHDVVKKLTQHLNIALEEVFISRFDNRAFYTELCFQAGEGEVIRLEARTADAIALAMRYGCPVYTTQEVMDEAGIRIVHDAGESVEDVQEEEQEREYKKRIRQRLNAAIECEDYELASMYRDILKAKKAKNK